MNAGVRGSKVRPWATLTALFCAWKALLLIVAAASPGLGYDTSTRILFSGAGRTNGTDLSSSMSTSPSSLIEGVVAKLTRWDAVYFASGAKEGNVFEQEWAFSWALKLVVHFIVQVAAGAATEQVDGLPSLTSYALAGIVVSHLAHLAAVFVLYRLVHAIVYDEHEAERLAFATAALHIVSPAGLFLSAPYGEAAFALFNLVGMLQYALAMHNNASYVKTRILTSGVAFGLATLIRGNGLLSGVIYAVDVFSLQLNMIGRPVTSADTRLLLAKYVAGACVGLGFAIPQIVAYSEYCMGGSSTRPWCGRWIPSVYSWVQSHYWGVGFLRYWTVSNIPLFILAAPMLALMLATACSVHLSHFSYLSRRHLITPSAAPSKAKQARPSEPRRRAPQRYANSTIRRLALPQGVLAVLAFSNFHVQIITRLSSGYPVWYFLLARAVVEDRAWFGWVRPRWVVQWMVVYALVQGALFASFLPPA